jgi:hypothetical protein
MSVLHLDRENETRIVAMRLKALTTATLTIEVDCLIFALGAFLIKVKKSNFAVKVNF